MVELEPLLLTLLDDLECECNVSAAYGTCCLEDALSENRINSSGVITITEQDIENFKKNKEEIYMNEYNETNPEDTHAYWEELHPKKPTGPEWEKRKKEIRQALKEHAYKLKGTTVLEVKLDDFFKGLEIGVNYKVAARRLQRIIKAHKRPSA